MTFIILLLFIFFGNLFYYYFQYRKFGFSILSDLLCMYNFSILIYFSIPIIFYSLLGDIFSGYNQNIVNETVYFGVYFMLVFSILTWIGRIRIDKGPKLIEINKITFTTLIIVSYIYLLFIATIYYPTLIGATGRRELSAIALELDKYKIKAIFYFILTISVLYAIHKRKYMYILLGLPFVAIDLTMGNRLFAFSFILSILVVMNSIKTQIKISYLVLLTFGTVLMAVFRDHNETDMMGDIILVVGETLFTWQSNFVILESADKISIVNWVLNTFFKFIMSFFNESYHDYKEIITENNKLDFGIAGHMLAEVLAFKSIMVTLISPFILYIYLYIINRLKNINTFMYTSYIVTYFSLISFLRGDFSKLIFYGLYISIITLPCYYWPKHMLKLKNHQSNV